MSDEKTVLNQMNQESGEEESDEAEEFVVESLTILTFVRNLVV